MPRIVKKDYKIGDTVTVKAITPPCYALPDGFRNRRGEILDYWIYSADGFSMAPNEFYSAKAQDAYKEESMNAELKLCSALILVRTAFRNTSKACIFAG